MVCMDVYHIEIRLAIIRGPKSPEQSIPPLCLLGFTRWHVDSDYRIDNLSSHDVNALATAPYEQPFFKLWWTDISSLGIQYW